MWLQNTPDNSYNSQKVWMRSPENITKSNKEKLDKGFMEWVKTEFPNISNLPELKEQISLIYQAWKVNIYSIDDIKWIITDSFKGMASNINISSYISWKINDIKNIVNMLIWGNIDYEKFWKHLWSLLWWAINSIPAWKIIQLFTKIIKLLRVRKRLSRLERENLVFTDTITV